MTFESRSNDRANGNVTEPTKWLYLNLRCSIRQKHGIFKFMSIFSNFRAHCPLQHPVNPKHLRQIW